MTEDIIINKLFDQLQKYHLKDFEIEINKLFKIKKNQNNFKLLNLYALFLETKKEYNKAISVFVKCIELNSKYPPPYFNLGRLYLHFKIYKSAINFLEKYLELNQEGLFDAEYFLARAYYFNYEYQKSINLLKKVFSKHNKDISKSQKVEILNLTGSAYTLNKDIENAINYYNEALNLDNTNVITLGNLANALRSQDKKAEALEVFKKTLKLDPKNVHLHKDLSVIIKYKGKDDKNLKEMLELYNSNDLSNKDKADLGFAIGKAFDDMGSSKEASDYLIPSNNERRLQFKYDFENEIKEFQVHSKLFSSLENKFSKLKNQNNVTRPIFILGMPRSGTTLAEQILSSHSEVEAGDEIFFLADSVQKSIPHKSLEDFSKNFLSHTEEKLKTLANIYLSELDVISKGKPNVTDKMPLNFKLIGLIYHSLPHAKIIHCARDGRDTCLSIYKNNFSTEKMAWAYDQKELSSFFNLYVDYMKLWKKLYGNFIFDLHYETVINDTENQVRKLLNFCDLKFEDSCLNFYKNKRAVQTVSTMQVRQPIYSSSVKAWESYDPYMPGLFKNINNY